MRTLRTPVWQFVAGSQRYGHLTYRPSDPSEHNVLNQSIDNPEQYGQIVFDVLKAGEVSLHSDLLLHGSDANDSDRRRCGLTLRYCSAEVHADLGWNEKGVIVRAKMRRDTGSTTLAPARAKFSEAKLSDVG